jgi:hypothetical protein
MTLPSGSSILRLLWLCFFSLPLYAQTGPLHSPLSPFLVQSETIPPASHELSLRFDYPIITINRKEFVGAGSADRFIEQFQMADNATNRDWFDRIRAAFSGRYEKGFAIKHPEPGRPCIVMSEGSYQDHVLGEGFLNILSEYSYHPYTEEQKQFETMVLYHEIGHCFESYDPLRAEHFADVFSALFQLRESGDWAALDKKLIPNRTLNLINGDFTHYSVPSLRAIHNWIDEPRELRTMGNPEIIQLAHIIVNDFENVPDQETLVRLRTQLQYILLEIAISIDQMDIDYFASDTSDRIEALRDQLILRQAENRRLLYELFADLEPGDLHAMEQLLHDVARSMYTVRHSQNDFYNEVQEVTYRIDVQNLYEAAGFQTKEAKSAITLIQASL